MRIGIVNFCRTNTGLIIEKDFLAQQWLFLLKQMSEIIQELSGDDSRSLQHIKRLRSEGCILVADRAIDS